MCCQLSYSVHTLGRHFHDDVIKWKHFPRYWSFVWEIHRSPVNSPHKGQWREALMFSLICAWINAWVNNGEAGDLIRHQAHYNVVVMSRLNKTVVMPMVSVWSGYTSLYIWHTVIAQKKVVSNSKAPSWSEANGDGWTKLIAQIALLSFQGSHRTHTQTSEVRWLHASVVTEWSPACLHKQFPGDLHRGN